MATGTFYLRPCEDVSLRHNVYPSTLGAGYLAISEKVDDGYATYLIVSSPSNSAGSNKATSIFKMGLDSNEMRIKVNRVLSATTHYHGLLSSAWMGGSFEVLIGETVYVSSDGYFDDIVDVDSPELVTAINSYIDANNGVLPEVLLSVYSYASSAVTTGTDSKGNTTTDYSQTSSYVYQVYVELTCEYEEVLDIGIHHKVNGEWKTASAYYKKEDFSWVEITKEECKILLENSICGRNK